MSSNDSDFGREARFKQLYTSYFAMIRRFFIKRGFPREESKDLAQEVFLRVYRHLDTVRSEGTVVSWLFQVATNVYRNRLRDQQASKRRANEQPLDVYHEEAASVADDENVLGSAGPQGPHEALVEREQAEHLERALAELPHQMRRCLMLRIYQDRKYREIATIMKISIETVKAHLYQGRSRLKSELARYLEEQRERDAS
ncbi:MAG: RNA polymerase sigma factor [Acidobacteriota bacterium]